MNKRGYLSSLHNWLLDAVYKPKLVNLPPGLLSDGRILVLVPGLLPDPLQLDSCVGPDLDGGSLCGRHRLLDRLHQVLRVADQHLGGLLVFLGAWKSSDVKYADSGPGGQLYKTSCGIFTFNVGATFIGQISNRPKVNSSKTQELPTHRKGTRTNCKVSKQYNNFSVLKKVLFLLRSNLLLNCIEA